MAMILNFSMSKKKMYLNISLSYLHSSLISVHIYHQNTFYYANYVLFCSKYYITSARP